eukprot:Skav230711  [mRNA]  locus=scaffold715:115456:117376:+ [translate_table: standard]
MRRSLHSKTLLQKLRTIHVDDPLNEAYLQQFHAWWRNVETPKRMSSSVREIAVNGHEKITTKCCHDVPARGGRLRKDGHIKLSYNGWLMATDPSTGVILGLLDMKDQRILKLLWASSRISPRITLESIVCCKTGRKAAKDSSYGTPLGPSAPREEGGPAAVSVERDEADDLAAPLVEKGHSSLTKGTQRALRRGVTAYRDTQRAQWWKPHARLDNGAWYLKALADQQQVLQDISR